jgi:hypothetical protein
MDCRKRESTKATGFSIDLHTYSPYRTIKASIAKHVIELAQRALALLEFPEKLFAQG